MGLFSTEDDQARAAVGGLAARMGALESLVEGIQGCVDQLGTDSGPGPDLASMREILTSETAPFQARLDDHETELLALDEWKKEILLAVADGIDRVARAEQRIGATIKRARKSLADAGYEDPGVEAEYGQLRAVDGGVSEGGELPTVSEDLAPSTFDPHAPSSVPGVSAGALAAVRSRR